MHHSTADLSSPRSATFHGARGATEIHFDEVELNQALVEQAFDGALERSWIESSETSTLDWLMRSMRAAAARLTR